MPLPVVAASLIGSIVAGIAHFFVSKAGTILAGLGITFLCVKGLEQFVTFAVGQMTSIITGITAAGGGNGLVSVAVHVAAYAGLFDGLNILISGYFAYVALAKVKLMLSRLQ